MGNSKKAEAIKEENLKDENNVKDDVETVPAENDSDGKSKKGSDKPKAERRKGERRVNERRAKPRRKNDIDNNRENVMKILIQEKDDEIIKLNNEIEGIKDQSLRRQAEFENFKKRSLKQQEDFKKFALKDFALDIITINDDVLRAIDASGNISKSIEEEHIAFVEGVSIISKRIEDTLNKYGVFEIEALNMEFDPNVHEAVEINTSDDIDVDTVSHVYQKGFKIEEQVVRSAKVRVTKAVKGE